MASWNEELLAKVNEICNESVKKWTQLIETLGVPLAIRIEWCTTYLKALKQLTNEMYSYLEEREKNMTKVISELKMKIKEFCYHLGVTPEFCIESNLSLEEQKLKAYLVQLQEQIAKKKEDINTLFKRQEKVCAILGKPVKTLPNQPLPSSSDLESFLKYIEALEYECEAREKRSISLKAELQALAREMDYEPENEFESVILSSTSIPFPVHDQNMSMLHSFEQSLKDRANNRKNEMNVLMDTIKQLWKTLETNEKYCISFMAAHRGLKKQDIEALKAEIKRLDALKTANLHVLIKRMQGQLVVQWDLCHFSEEQRTNINIPNEELYTDETYTFYQNEIDKLTKYYQENQVLFESLAKFEITWRRMDEFEAEGQGRFKNRGGKLVIDEKEHKLAKKRLSKLQQSIIKMADDYYATHHKEFIYEGISIQEYFKSFEAKYRIRREWCTTYLEKLEQMLSDKFNHLEEHEKNTTRVIAELKRRVCDAASLVGIIAEYPIEPSLHQEEYKLKAYLAHLEEKIVKRKTEVAQLLHRQEKVCSALGKPPRILKEDPLPSGMEVESFLLYVESLEDEFVLREVNYNTLRGELKNLADQIEYEPVNEFETNILTNSAASFDVTDKNMLLLSNFETTLKQHANNIKTRVCFFMESISELWSILDIDADYCAAFQNAHQGLKKENVSAMQKEFKRLEELKKANLPTLIQQLRKQLVAQWDLCHFSEHQRHKSGLMDVDAEDTEEMFTRLQQEKRKLTKYYVDNEILFKSLSKFVVTWRRVNETPEHGRTKYSLHGKEDKERKYARQQLRKLYQSIMKMGEEYFTINEQEFTYDGMTLENYFKLFDAKEEPGPLKASSRLAVSRSSNHLDCSIRACTGPQVVPSSSWHQLSSQKDIESSLKSLVVACFRPYSIPSNDSC